MALPDAEGVQNEQRSAASADELPSSASIATAPRGSRAGAADAAPSRSPRRDGTSISEEASGVRGSSAATRWPGCYVAHRAAPWILGVESLDSAGLQEEEEEDPGGSLPDLSFDPRRKVLTAINAAERERCFFISLPGRYTCMGAKGTRLVPGSSRDESGLEQPTFCFILVLRPRSLMDVCRFPKVRDVSSIEVQSDVFNLEPFPPEVPAPSADAASAAPRGFPDRFVYGFPLGGPGPFLCSQGPGGELTHFAHPSTYHAIDLDCPVGTPVLAIAAGTVLDVRDAEGVSGVDVRNFFRWNQVTVQHEDGSIAEYVHVQAGSARVEVGAQVLRGQVICCSGDVGFCPTPHLHLEVHIAHGKDAPSVSFGFMGVAGPFRCKAGQYYSADGPVQ
eukprot:TRINITY_DN30419_c0_g2_i1.p1 TRINITY_DN30419_c0_g2~~TRINITY_DN30419_c0_g2_i1.p1  ORF type:complete len:391 (-),score=71.38 TRINITY_DN30419_c0_g2_i1:391-1563(-)